MGGLTNPEAGVGSKKSLFMPDSSAFLTGRDTDMNEEQFRDVQMQQYLQMVMANERLLPIEVRLLKQLMSMESEQDRRFLLEQAFKPPPITYDATQSDELYSTPILLFNHVEAMLQALDLIAEKSGVKGQVMPG